MKKFVFFLMMCCFLCSCKENRREQIEKFMYENLLNYDGFEIIKYDDLETITEVEFRCKTAGGLSKINLWLFMFNDYNEITDVMDYNSRKLIYSKSIEEKISNM